jgi:redox-sensitive bicupin YhaK (pirin superfamily)
MISIRRSEERGRGQHGWLDSRHTFSFADYHDPKHMGFGVLRVINEDRVQPGEGFGTHGHQDMEIISYVLEGALEHKDSMGNGSVLRAGDFQRMSAGTGVRHSEFNPSATEPVHFYQIWVFPERRDIEPSYEERHLGDGVGDGLTLVACRSGESETMRICQDAKIYLARLQAEQELQVPLDAKRRMWVQVTRGSLSIDGNRLGQGDGAAITESDSPVLQGEESAEALVFDLP